MTAAERRRRRLSRLFTRRGAPVCERTAPASPRFPFYSITATSYLCRSRVIFVVVPLSLLVCMYVGLDFIYLRRSTCRSLSFSRSLSLSLSSSHVACGLFHPCRISPSLSVSRYATARSFAILCISLSTFPVTHFLSLSLSILPSQFVLCSSFLSGCV